MCHNAGITQFLRRERNLEREHARKKKSMAELISDCDLTSRCPTPGFTSKTAVYRFIVTVFIYCAEF